MDRFCIRQMRKEYRGAVRVGYGFAVALLLTCAVLGAVARAKHPDSWVFVLFLGAQAFIVMAMIGLYLILTDDKRPIRVTPFGQALSRLGDPEELIGEIIKARINEARAKKGYLVKGDGAEKVFEPIGNRNTK